MTTNRELDKGESKGEGEGEGEQDVASDGSLLRQFRRGQGDASTLLYLRYAHRLRGLAAKKSSPDLARRVEPDEIVQSVFRTFFRRASRGEYDVPEGEEIWKLLLVIALNKVRTAGAHHRAAKRDISRTAGGAEYDRAIESTEAGDEAALTVLRMVIDDALLELDETPRRMVELRIEGHEVAEIAELVRRSKRSVERVLQEFRTRLGGLIQDDEEEPLR